MYLFCMVLLLLSGADLETIFWGNKKSKRSEFPISTLLPLRILEGARSGYFRIFKGGGGKKW